MANINFTGTALLQDFKGLLFKLEAATPGPDDNEVVYCFEGEWFFYDETWTNAYGPYGSRAAAARMLDEYCEKYL